MVLTSAVRCFGACATGSARLVFPGHSTSKLPFLRQTIGFVRERLVRVVGPWSIVDHNQERWRPGVTFEAVDSAEGVIVKPRFAFPDGQRFRLVDPNGDELVALLAS